MLTLVTGATGLVGNNVVRLLLQRGQRVRALARRGIDMRALSGLDVQVQTGDVCDAATLPAAFEGVTQVIHAAAQVKVGWRDLELLQRVNVGGTRHVAAAARQAGARMVHVSSCDACGIGTPDDPADEETTRQGDVPLPYVVTKREAERVIHEEIARGLWATIVNPGFMLGPSDWKPSSGRMLVEVARGRGLLAPPGVFSICDVRDVAAGILAALERGQCGRRYILAGHTISYLDAWRLFAEAAGVRRPWGNVTPLLGRLAGWGGDAWGKISGREPDVNSGAIALARLPKSYSSLRAQTELGYRIRPLRDTVEDALRWFRQNGYLPAAAAAEG